MKLFINGDINTYYVQTFCMIFFPGAKFSEDEPLTEMSDVLELDVSYINEGVVAKATMKSGGKSAFSERFEPFSENVQNLKTAKIACGIAIFSAGEELFDCSPPWGILTGVRPAKIATELFEEGKKSAEIREILSRDYFLNPKKAALLTTIAKKEMTLIRKMDKNSCSVYISIPFCPSRCAYCSFVSYSTKRLLSMIDVYLEQLFLDIDHMFQNIKKLNMKVTTVYIGGGTPSILTPEQIKRLIEKISSHTDLNKLLEFTFEAGRPDTVTQEKMKLLSDMNVTRVSVNPQTLNDTILENIGRQHNTNDFFKAYNIARDSGIKYINTDLIAGLPGESFASFSRSVDDIIRLKPDNITFHTFCVKKASDFLRRGTDVYSRNGGDTGKGIDYSQVSASLAGYLPYYIYRQKNTVGNFENVGYALPGTEGLYNVFMMEELHSVFSAGAGSVTKLVSPDRKVIKRAVMPKYPYEYMNPENHEKIQLLNDNILDEFAENYFK